MNVVEPRAREAFMIRLREIEVPNRGKTAEALTLRIGVYCSTDKGEVSIYQLLRYEDR